MITNISSATCTFSLGMFYSSKESTWMRDSRYVSTLYIDEHDSVCVHVLENRIYKENRVRVATTMATIK